MLTPGDTDQCFMLGETMDGFVPADLLVTAGANGTAGTVNVYHRLDHGGMALRRVDMPMGADAIEGVVVSAAECVVGNDASTHSGGPALNRVLRYPA